MPSEEGRKQLRGAVAHRAEACSTKTQPISLIRGATTRRPSLPFCTKNLALRYHPGGVDGRLVRVKAQPGPLQPDKLS